MNREEADLVWFVVLYVGALTSAIVFLRTLFVPPKTPAGTTERKSPFELWMAFSQQRAQEDLQADLEKYKIDKGLIPRLPSSWDAREVREAKEQRK